MVKGLFLFSLFIFIPFIVQAKALDKALYDAEQLKLEQNQHWLNLLHYRKSFWGGYKSEADGLSFFFAGKEGRANPKSELVASLKAFYQSSPKDPNQHPRCLFPARFRYLNKTLKLGLNSSCPEFEKFRQRFKAKSLSLVFSSYYINRPASAFGHTLLRFNKQTDVPDSERHELLDYATNYAATVTTQNAFLYALLGLAGGFSGEFAAIPYFYKVREYNDYESRDLWDYELKLTTEEIEMVVAHVWEMKQTYFTYFYLTENCSYHMLGLLDAANPNWRLAERNPYFVIPVDTIRTIVETPGLVKKVSFRASKQRVLKERLKELNSKEHELFNDLLKNMDPKTLPENISTQSKAKVLDAAIDYIDYEYAKEVLLEKSDAMKWKRHFLIARSKTGIRSEEVKIPTPKNDAPHEGHRSRRLGLDVAHADHTGLSNGLEYRFSFHDFLDLPTGQNPNATMEMGKLKVRYNHKVEYRGNSSQFIVDEFTLINVVALSPLEKYFSSYSWRVYLGSQTIRDKGCSYCFSPLAQIGGGFSQKFSSFFYYLFLTSDLEIAKKIGHHGFRAGVGPEANITFRPFKPLAFSLFGEYKYRFFVDHKTTYKFGSEIHWHTSQNIALNFKFTRFEREGQVLLGPYFYF